MRGLLALLLLSSAAWCENWPQWRGPMGTGVSAEKGLPTEWSRTQNIAWRSSLARLGVSSPVVWGDRIFVTYENGETLVLRSGRKPEILARYKLDLRVIASPAISDGRIYMRGDRELVAIQTGKR